MQFRARARARAQKVDIRGYQAKPPYGHTHNTQRVRGRVCSVVAGGGGGGREQAAAPSIHQSAAHGADRGPLTGGQSRVGGALRSGAAGGPHRNRKILGNKNSREVKTKIN